MKLLNGTFENFGSYKQVEIDFNGRGLTLVYGDTGSGKSTIPDMAAWVLFGITAKAGNVDDVRSWQASGEPTTGTIHVDCGAAIIITRVRGSSKQNDLYWLENGTTHRGKDLPDTQRLLEDRLGITAELFLTGSYFHEFSKSSHFFTSKPKDRRAVLEEVADLSLPVKIAAKASISLKEAKEALVKAQGTKDNLEGRIEATKSVLDASNKAAEAWDNSHEIELNKLTRKFETFETDKANNIAQLQDRYNEFEKTRAASIDEYLLQIAYIEAAIDPNAAQALEIALSNLAETYAREGKCPTCLTTRTSDKTAAAQTRCTEAQKHSTQNRELAEQKEELIVLIEQRVQASNPMAERITNAMTVENNYADWLEFEKTKINPHDQNIVHRCAELQTLTDSLVSNNTRYTELDRRKNALSQVRDLCDQLRGELLNKALAEIEVETNRYLEAYFDAEIRVGFIIADADSIDISIQKSGNECNFKQLSKGQRQLLRLCFSVSIMKAASNKAGIYFDTLFLDEAFDGLDAKLKVKAFRLLEELAKDRSSVFVIDHLPEFQNLFSNKIHVELNGDYSELEHE